MDLNIPDVDDWVTHLPKTIQTKWPILTDAQRDIMFVVASVFCSSAICLFGMIANIINVIVFYKQGFKNTVNMSFLGLALSDFATVLTLEWFCICVNPWFMNADIPFYSLEFQYLTASTPHVSFTRITCAITAFMTVERCLGVLVPLKVKRIITPRVTIIVLISIFLVNILSVVPEYFVVQYDWKFYEGRNKTLLGLVPVVGHNSANVGYVGYTLSPLLGAISFVVVSVFTAILVAKLKQISKWRSSVVNKKEQAGTLSSRDKSTMRLVITIASVLIVCNIPGVIFIAAMIFEPEFSINGVYVRLFLGIWSFPPIFSAINSSINIFFYYRMSTTYRQSLHELLRGCKTGNKA